MLLFLLLSVWMQNMSEGGLRDKPEMHSDLYHTMYCLCGLSVLGALDVIVSSEC